MEHVYGDDFKPQHYLIKSATALTVEHVIGPDRAKRKVKEPALALSLCHSLRLHSPLLKHSVTARSGTSYN